MDAVAESGVIGWPRLAGRFARVALILLHHGTAGALASGWRRLSGAGPAATATRLSTTLVELGPTFIKGGQLLSTRADLLSPRACHSLGRLHDRVPPMDRAQAELAIRHAYRGRPGPPFADFDWTPVASGSIACVYRAALPDGRQVAVKVRRPGIQDRMRADFALLAGGARAMQWLPGMRDVPVRRMVEQVGGAVLAQLNFAAEAEALARLRANLAAQPGFRVPEPLPAASADGVLVMEYVDGLDRFGPEGMNREDRRTVVRLVLHGVYRMLFVDGLVHCDMHPGNLYLTRDGEAVLLDAGFVVRLSPAVQRLFAEFFLNMSLGRGEECAEVVLRSSEHTPPGADLTGFRNGIIELVGAAHRRTAGQFRLAPFATRLFDLQRRSGIAAAPEFVFPLASLLVLEGMINEFDVDVDFQAEAIPTLLGALRR